jgi:isopenicillin N synthase-like dioxygenase
MAACDLERGWCELLVKPALEARSIQLLDIARALFDLPPHIKRACSSPVTNFQSGWRASDSAHRPSEVWHFTEDDPPNCWPQSIDESVRQDLLKFMTDARGIVAPIVAEAVRSRLGAEYANCPSKLIAHSTLRFLHYSPSDKDWRFGDHTDLGIATVFFGETQSGLEVFDGGSGGWQRVAPNAKLWLMIGGELLAKLCSSRKLACRHRVRKCLQDRYSAVMFLHPRDDMVVAQTLAGQPITAADFFSAEMAKRMKRLKR